MTKCPCCSEKNYQNCCQPYVELEKIPETPEALMRSRYTAYTQANVDYIIETMKGEAAKNFDLVSAKQWAEAVKWISLNVTSTREENDKGFVGFEASFILNEKLHVMHENSEFLKENDKWFYIKGDSTVQLIKLNRNDPCPCGSNKKFKKCCAL